MCQPASKNDPFSALKNDPPLSLLFDFRSPDESRLDLFLEPIRVSLDVDRRRVVKDPVQDSRGDDGIAEDLIPLAEAAVRGQDQGPLFVAPRDELKEQMGTVTVDGDVADLVDDQQFGLTVELEPFFNTVLSIGLGQPGNERHGLSEAGPVAVTSHIILLPDSHADLTPSRMI